MLCLRSCVIVCCLVGVCWNAVLLFLLLLVFDLMALPFLVDLGFRVDPLSLRMPLWSTFLLRTLTFVTETPSAVVATVFEEENKGSDIFVCAPRSPSSLLTTTTVVPCSFSASLSTSVSLPELLTKKIGHHALQRKTAAGRGIGRERGKRHRGRERERGRALTCCHQPLCPVRKKTSRYQIFSVRNCAENSMTSSHLLQFSLLVRAFCVSLPASIFFQEKNSKFKNRIENGKT